MKYQTDIHLYRNIEEKLYVTNASISFKTKNLIYLMLHQCFIYACWLWTTGG